MTSRPALNVYDRRYCLVAHVQQDQSRALRDLLAERDYAPDELARALREAADRGYEQCAEVLLMHQALPDLHDSKGFTPLIMAARKGHANLIKLLMKHNANINKPTYRIRATALHWAATNGHYGAVRALVAEGANTECCTVHSRTPLMLAARSDQPQIVDVLIEAGAKVNALDYERATALHLAAEEGALDCVETLLVAGSDVNAQTRTGDTPIIKAARGGHPDVLRMLFRRGGDMSRRGRCMSAAHWAAEGGSVECMKLFLKQGVNPDEVTEDSYCGADFLVSAGVTPLMLAARGGYSLLITLLLQSGAAPDRVDDDGRSALMYAVHANHAACVTTLLQLGADPDGVPLPRESPADNPENTDQELVASSRGLSPLFLAIKRSVYEILFILLRANCSVAVAGQTSQGEDLGPLEYALSLKKKTCIYALLAAGAGRSIINRQSLQNSLLSLVQCDEPAAFHLMHLLASPLSLMQACRSSIRGVLGRHNITRIGSLPLPPILQRYINFSEFEEYLEAYT